MKEAVFVDSAGRLTVRRVLDELPWECRVPKTRMLGGCYEREVSPAPTVTFEVDLYELVQMDPVIYRQRGEG